MCNISAKDDIVYIEGECTAATLEHAQASLSSYISQSVTDELKFDLAKVTKLDSFLLAVILTCKKAAKQQQKTVKLLHIPDHLITLSKLSRMDHLL